MRVPIRLRLTLAFAAGMALVLSALGAFLYVRVGDDLLNGIDMELRSRAQVVLTAIRANGPSLVRTSHGELIDPDEAFAQVLSARGGIVDASRAVAKTPMIDRATLLTIGAPTFLTRQVFAHDDPARLLAIPVGTGAHRTFVVVGATMGDRNDALRRLLLELGIGGPVALALVSLAGWRLAGAALRPVERMRREAAAISLAEPERRLSVAPTGDEIERLGTTLNSMLDRLHASLQREQRFLDEASHELRTPLGVLRMELDLALSRARTPEELHEALLNASRETERLVRLAEDLLVLSRERDGTLRVHRRDTSIGELMQQVANGARARADAESVELRITEADGLVARVDPDRMRQALDDLVDNAIRHAGRGRRVTLSAQRDDGSIRVIVVDDGPGYPLDVLRDGDGTDAGGASPSGLGLAIVRAIARAHGGGLVLSNGRDGGAIATLEVPSSPTV